MSIVWIGGITKHNNFLIFSSDSPEQLTQVVNSMGSALNFYPVQESSPDRTIAGILISTLCSKKRTQKSR